MIDWQRIAPKYADWERLLKLFAEDGLPACRFRNGIPEFDGEVDWERVEELVTGTAMPRPEIPPRDFKPSNQPVKRGRGRPKTK